MDKSYRIAIAGCGGMSLTWIDYALGRSDCDIVAMVDIRIEAAQAMAEKFKINCGVYTDLATAIQETGANLVLDVTIPASHFQVATTALKLGCNVMSEKPLAESLDQCREIVRLSEATGRKHAVMQNRRYNPQIIAVRQMVENGTIGKAGYAGVDFHIGAHFGGFRDLMDNVLLLDMAIHTFDQARKILGSNPVSVYCHEYNMPGSWYVGNASAICIFEMTDGSVFCYRGSWSTEGASTSWEGSWRVAGERGTIIWDGTNAPYAEVVAPSDQEGKFLKDLQRVESKIPLIKEGHHGCLDEMFAALEQTRPAETDCHDNILSMAMVFAAIESAKTGLKVKIEI
jgi:predicted dehydrogenase